MTKTSVSRLKAKLGQYMRAVRQGREVVITDRDEPVARLVPYRTTPVPSALELVHAAEPDAPPPGKVIVLPIRYQGPSTTAILREERNRR